MDGDPGLAIFDAVRDVRPQPKWRLGLEVGGSFALLVALTAVGLLAVLAIADGVGPFVSWLLSVVGIVRP
jgi:hypothetical protein